MKRFYSSGKTPRFVETLKQASKPALKNSISITRPFGLSKPLLLTDANTIEFSSISNIKTQLFSSSAKEQRQKQLDHDIAHSQLYESKSFRNVNGKIFIPPVSFFKKDKSLYFPDFIAETLVKPEQRLTNIFKGKVNILRIYSTVSGDLASQTYFQKPGAKNGNYLTDNNQEFCEKFPNSQIIDINMPSSLLKKFVVKMSKGNLKKIVPENRHNNYFIAPYKLFPIDIRKKLNCDNSCSGYIYLVDENSKIRWATSGEADQAEFDLMWKCVRGLEKELKLTLESK